MNELHFDQLLEKIRKWHIAERGYERQYALILVTPEGNDVKHFSLCAQNEIHTSNPFATGIALASLKLAIEKLIADNVASADGIEVGLGMAIGMRQKEVADPMGKAAKAPPNKSEASVNLN